MSKYKILGEFLARQRTDRVAMSFAEIERMIGTKLPPSARKHRPWWSNNPNNSVMTKVWLAAGFESAEVDMGGRRLVFRRVRGPVETPQGPGGGLAEPAGAFAHEGAAAGSNMPANTTALTSGEFERDASGARKAASHGPVLITEHGRAAHVLLTIEDYLRLTGRRMSLAEALAQPGADFDFDPPRIGSGIYKAADLG